MLFEDRTGIVQADADDDGRNQQAGEDSIETHILSCDEPSALDPDIRKKDIPQSDCRTDGCCTGNHVSDNRDQNECNQIGRQESLARRVFLPLDDLVRNEYERNAEYDAGCIQGGAKTVQTVKGLILFRPTVNQ